MTPSLLIYGIGNPGRGDDGVAMALLRELESSCEASGHKTRFSIDANYQLNIEDALTLADYKVVVFVDAWNAPPASGKAFLWEELQTDQTLTAGGFSHQMSCSQVLTLCKKLYGRQPKSYLLAIAGSNWEVNAPLSGSAQKNLNLALKFLTDRIPELYA